MHGRRRLSAALRSVQRMLFYVAASRLGSRGSSLWSLRKHPLSSLFADADAFPFDASEASPFRAPAAVPFDERMIDPPYRYCTEAEAVAASPDHKSHEHVVEGTTYYMIWETPWASAMGVSMWHADYVGDAPACACEDHGHDHDHDDHAAEEAEDVGVVADETETESDGASAGARLAAAAAVVALAAIL